MSLTLYRTAPTAETKAVAECRRSGIKAHTLTIGVKRVRRNRYSKQTQPRAVIASGYVVAHARPHEPVHVREALGAVSAREIASLARTARSRPRTDALEPGTRVKIRRGPFADLSGTVIDDKGPVLRVDVEMLGKRHRTVVHREHVAVG